jgi:hypothetical protein
MKNGTAIREKLRLARNILTTTEIRSISLKKVIERTVEMSSEKEI